ncbi:UDP-N-acetylmuramoyl-tripeptide--D-alanyl-D-alanine ligase [Persephonella sp.]
MKIKDIASILGIKADKTVENRSVSSFQIDSRKIKKGDFFVPLKGSKTDGHLFIDDALKKGASGYFTAYQPQHPEGLQVQDTLEALTQIGKHRRKLLNTAVGITGTSGKTTTKELLSFALSEFFSVYSTYGNYNNEIGVPLVLSNIPDDAQVGVFEFGAGKVGDISYLVNIAQPEIRALTSVGYGHTEKFGSFENVVKGKGEIFEGGEIAILPESLLRFYDLKKRITFGTEESSDVRILYKKITQQGTEGAFQIRNRTYDLFIPAYNLSLVDNVAVVLSVALYMELDLSRILDRLKEHQLPEGRGRLLKHKNITIIDDTYNANPLSVRNAVETLHQIPSFKILVLGDMLELGQYSEKLHRQIGQLIKNSSIDLCIFYGKEMKYAYEEVCKIRRSFFIKNKDEAVSIINQYADSSPVVLVKGSRGMKMEEVIQKILES